MTKKMQKKIEVFKLEERVLFDAAAAADIVEAMQNDPAVQSQQSEAERQAQEDQNALKNAAPENPVNTEDTAKNSQPTSAEAVKSADADAAVKALMEGAIPVSEITVEDGSDPVEAAFPDDLHQADDAGRELLILNSSIRDKEAFISEAGENADILVIDRFQDAMDQINEYVDGKGVKYSSVHIITHGNEGYFLLGSEVVTAESVAKAPADWAAFGEHLTADADIMLYSCNLAANQDGQALVAQIANLTGADVAASTDVTGAAGNWDYEYSIGAIENQFLQRSDYSRNLDTITYTVDGSGNGTDEFDTLADAFEAADDSSNIYAIVVTVDSLNNGDLVIGNEFDIAIVGVGADINITADSITIGAGSDLVIAGVDFTVGDLTIKNDGFLGVAAAGAQQTTLNIGTVEDPGKVTADSSSQIQVASGNATFNVGANSTFGDIVIAGGNATFNVGANSTFGDIVITSGTMSLDAKAGLSVTGRITSRGGELELTASEGGASLGGGLMIKGGDVTLNLGDDANDAASAISGIFWVYKAESVTTNADLRLNGYNVSVTADVTVFRGGSLSISGSNITFMADFLNYQYDAMPPEDDPSYSGDPSLSLPTNDGLGYKWLHEYLTNDAEYYSYYNISGIPEDPQSTGSVTIEADADRIAFQNLVVSGGDFTINGGDVSFSSTVAVAAGTFNITGGNVHFSANLYVSSTYKAEGKTEFTVSGGDVSVSGSLYNWVRIPLFAYGTDSKVPQFGGSFSITQDNKLILKAASGSSSVSFAGGEFVVSGDMANIGVWGEVDMTVTGSASVTVKGDLINFSNAKTFWNGTHGSATALINYPVTIMGETSGFTAVGVNFPWGPFQDGHEGHASFSIMGDSSVVVEGESFNGASDRVMGRSGRVYGNYSSFVINSTGSSVFYGDFTNTGDLQVQSGGNTFADVTTAFSMTVLASNSFKSITNTYKFEGAEANLADLYFTSPGATSLSLINIGKTRGTGNYLGQVFISGNADGFALTEQLTINGGKMVINSDFGLDIDADVNVINNGFLEIGASNTFSGDITVTSGHMLFNANAAGSDVNGAVAIGANGTLEVNTDGPMTFNNTITNDGKFLLGGQINVAQKAEIINNASVIVSGLATVGAQFNNLGSVTISASGAGSSFSNMTNSGTIVNNAANSSFTTFKNNAGAVYENNAQNVSFAKLTNEGTMNIDGSINAADTTNAAAGSMYVNGVASLGTTTNNGKIYLQPLTGAHAAEVHFGDLTHNGVITSKDDTRNAGDIFFEGTTNGNGNLNGFTGTVHYNYNGEKGITQSFYANKDYGQVTVDVAGNGNGQVTLSENITFRALNINGGNLRLANGITLDTQAFNEVSAGTITVDSGSTLVFAGNAALASKLVNNGEVRSSGDLNLGAATSGSGTLWLGTGAGVTYSGDVKQTIFRFANGSSTDVTLTGAGVKTVDNFMRLSSLTMDGATLQVNNTLELNGLNATGNNNAVTVQKGGVLNMAFAGTVSDTTLENNGTADMAGTADGKLVWEEEITNAGSMSLNAGADAGSIRNSGTLTVAKDAAFNLLQNDGGTATLKSSGNLLSDIIVNNGSVVFDGGADVVSENRVTATGGSVKVASGSLTLNYNAGTFGAGIDVAEGTTLTFAGTDSVTVTGKVTNAGTLVSQVAGADDGRDPVTFKAADGGLYLAGGLINTGDIRAEGTDAVPVAVLRIDGTAEYNNAAGSISATRAAGASNGFGVIYVYNWAAGADYGDVVKDGDSGSKVYGLGSNVATAYSVTGDVLLSEFLAANVLTSGENLRLNFAADASLTVDTASDETNKLNEIRFRLADGSALVFETGFTVSNDLTGGAGTVTVGSNNADADVIFEGSVYDIAGIAVNTGSTALFSNADVQIGTAVDNAGTLAFAGDASFGDAVTNSGEMTVAGAADFGAAVDNTGTLAFAGDASFGDAVTNSGEMSVAGDAGFDSTVDNTGLLDVSGDAAFGGAVKNDGVLGVVGNAAFSGTFTNNDLLDVSGDASFGDAVTNGSEMYVAGDAGFDSTVDNTGFLDVSGDAAFSGAVTNSGEMYVDGVAGFDSTVDNTGLLDADNMIFNGQTSGNGTIDDGNSAIYNAAGSQVFRGTYGDLAVNADSSAAGDITVNGVMTNTGSLALGKGQELDVNGTTSGNGTIQAADGSFVKYGENAAAFGGQYDDVQLGNGNVSGNMAICGNATSLSGSINAVNGTVTYNGTGHQLVLGGNYDSLELIYGNKAMADIFVNGSFTVRDTTLRPASGETFDVDAAASRCTIINSTIYGMNFLRGGLAVGPGNTLINSEGVFVPSPVPAGSFPSQGNADYCSLSFSLANELMNAQMYEDQLLEEFRLRRTAPDQIENTVSDISLDFSDNEDLLASAGSMLDEAIRTFSDSSIAVETAVLAANDVVVASGVFQDELDEALEELLKD
ncbi:MAG: DUF4347 domain-containing protein [Lentisphaeria bacterium]|nr:DUF4347 domain-containing protein [Lentisphaeria bacterium]